MPHHELDPTASTDKFRAFVDEGEPERGGQRKGSKARLAGAVVGGLVLLVIIAAVAWGVLGG